MRKAKRLISKTKTYGFNPWVDQFDAISQIMSDTGEKESTVLRKLIDEALIARRRKIADDDLAIESTDEGAAGTLRAIQTLLVKLVGQSEKSLRVQDVGLALLQDTLAEARAGRKVGWEQLVSRLKERGLNTKEISKRFEEETIEAKDFAYSTAKEIKSRQKK
jgi:hypothetical protein